MKQYQYRDLTIELIDEPTYKLDSIDNKFIYSKHYFGDEATEYPTSKHGIKIYQDTQIIDSCIVIGSGGATDIHKNSSIIDKEQLIICCCNTVFLSDASKARAKMENPSRPSNLFSNI